MNKYFAIGRLTTDVRSHTFQNGGKVANFGLAVPFKHAKWNPQEKKWQGGDTTFISVDVFDRENFKLATICAERLAKGYEVGISGPIKLDIWKDQEGKTHSRLKVIADSVDFLRKPPGQEERRDNEIPVREDNDPIPENPEAYSDNIPF